MERTYKVGGMTCGGCVSSVTNALTRLSPDLDIQVSLDDGTARVRGEHEGAVIERAIEDAGFDFAGEAPGRC